MSDSTDTGYQVLARKYRPETFADLVGQDAMVRTLRNAFEADRIAQAFIMTGIRGTGKTTTARIIAKGMNCIGPDGDGGPTTDPCGVCEHCVAISEGRHVDEARAAINQLQGGGGADIPNADEYLARENALNLPPITRSILEQRLAAIGLDPGRIDGRFDNQTRRAIEQFQRSRGLQATGYFDRATVARLLAESFGGVIQLDGVLR